MSYVFNSERTFKDEALDGLTKAYGRYLRRVPGASGAVSVSAPVPGRVSTIVGGGSGHFPSFAGLVGPGLADAAVCGDIFTSPSAEQVYRTIRAVDGGAGVVMLFGNYAGDVMHFGLAADQAVARDGIDARIVVVTDDIASAPSDCVPERRGIAGDLFVFRAAASAAHRGDSVDDVVRLARACNDATRTIGVGFDGCTVPGRDNQLFTVPAGSMVVGLGIHGEPGILTVERTGADDLAQLLVDRLLAEQPAGAQRARVLVNGLGRVKYEELFVLYRAVVDRLASACVELTEPEVGEFVTSLDMAGCSVTLVWADDELEELLSAPCAAPGYSRPGNVPGLTDPVRPLASTVTEQRAAPVFAEAELLPSGRLVRAGLIAVAVRLAELETHLGDLDAVAADGDHGTTMTRGMDAAVAAAQAAGPDASAILVAAGMAFADAAGGASGALWGSGLTTVGHAIEGAPVSTVDSLRLAEALRAAYAAVTRLGGCAPGQKTLVDALHPFINEFEVAAHSGADPLTAWAKGVAAANDGARATAGLTAARGRAARVAERSKGSEDPGAVSLAAALEAAQSAAGIQAGIHLGTAGGQQS